MLGQIGHGIHYGIAPDRKAQVWWILGCGGRAAVAVEPQSVCCSYLGQTPAVKLRMVVKCRFS
jgi:hypothetical protein